MALVTVLLSGCSSLTPGSDELIPASSPDSQTTKTPQPEPESNADPVVANVFNEPWPSGFTRRELADTALARTYAFFDQRQQGSSEELLTLVFQDTVDPFHHEWVTDVSTLTVESFAPYIVDRTLLVVGTNQEFFEDTVLAEGWPYNASAIPSGSDVCVAYQGTSWVSNQHFTKDRFPSDKNWSACIAHELFHVAQDAQDKGPGSQTFPPGHEFYRPLWLTEGSAQYMGHALMSYAGHYEYWGTHYTVGANSEELERPLLKIHESWETGGFESYLMGSLATEYIIASVGVEPLMDIWTVAGQGASFEEAFEQALGITVDEFYDRFDTMNVEMITE